ncbi:hypothetical protein ACET3Z_032128 [Daucus carota]
MMQKGIGPAYRFKNYLWLIEKERRYNHSDHSSCACWLAVIGKPQAIIPADFKVHGSLIVIDIYLKN